MPAYEYRCLDCRKVFSIERSMGDKSGVACQECKSDKLSRIWNAYILSSGTTPDVGQGSLRSANTSASRGGCSSCSSSSCGTCH